MQTLSNMTNSLAALTIPELRERQEIVEAQLTKAHGLRLQDQPIPDDAVERMQTYQNALMLAIDRVAFDDNDQ